MIRLRQIALVTSDFAGTVASMGEKLGLRRHFVDPECAEFGLQNAVFCIGDQFLEVLAPTEENTTAGRLIERRGGDTGYMVIYEVDDLARHEALTREAGVRVVWKYDYPEIAARHLHPSDMGAIVSFDRAVPTGSWRWAGPWEAFAETDVVTGIAGVTVGTTDPQQAAKTWSAIGILQSVALVPAGPRGPGVDAVDLVASDRARAGETLTVGGLDIRLV